MVNELIISLYLIVFLIYLMFVLNYYFNYKQKKRSIENFLAAFGSGLFSGMIKNFDDVVNIYKATHQIITEDLNYRYDLSNLLRNYFVAYIKTYGKIPINGEDKVKLFELKEMVIQFIKKNDSLSPYADLPLNERNILGDISTLIDSNEKEKLEQKLKELASVLKVRNQEYNNNKKLNIISIPLAIIGLILSIYQILYVK